MEKVCSGRAEDAEEVIAALRKGFSIVAYGSEGIGKSTFLKYLYSITNAKKYMLKGIQRHDLIGVCSFLGCETGARDTVGELIEKISQAAEGEKVIFFIDDANPANANMLIRNVNARFVFMFSEREMENVKSNKDLATCYSLELKPLNREAMHLIARQYSKDEDEIGRAIAQSYGNPFSLISSLRKDRLPYIVREEYDVTHFVVLFFVLVLAYRFIALASSDTIAYAVAGSIWAAYYLVRFLSRGRKG